YVNHFAICRSSLESAVGFSTTPRLCTSVSTAVARALSSTLDDGANKTHDHCLHFKLERYFAVAMVPLFPPFHGRSANCCAQVVNDYARPFVIGDTLVKTARACIYIITAARIASLHFNNNGVTNALNFAIDETN
ncbi:CybS, partial [Ostertagia ostertagi]